MDSEAQDSAVIPVPEPVVTKLPPDDSPPVGEEVHIFEPPERFSGKAGEAVEALEDFMERFLFASRWILAPLYLGLVGGLLVILVKFGQAFWDLARNAIHDDLHHITLGLLELLDITLLANLVLIMVFAGYETFVSKIEAAMNSVDRPHWMGKVDYSGLKMKLIGSIVAISVIGLLQDFLNETPADFNVEKWRIGIHLTFLGSGVLFALMDYIAEKRAGLAELREGPSHATDEGA